MNAQLVKALNALSNPHKDSKADTGKFAYGYASLAAVLDHVRPVLAAHGVAVAQRVSSQSGLVGVETVLLTEDGEWSGGVLLMPVPNDPQKVGSALTYARRYSLLATLGIAADEDDDAASATRATREPLRVVAGGKKTEVPSHIVQAKNEILELAGNDKTLAGGMWHTALEACGVSGTPDPAQAAEVVAYVRENMQ